jgi:predicted DNA-binding transcriptional regulator AlpA
MIHMKETTTTITAPAGAPEIYTPDDIMAILHIGRSSVYKLFSSEGFPSIKMGGILRVEKTKFEKWLNTYSGRSYTM